MARHLRGSVMVLRSDEVISAGIADDEPGYARRLTHGATAAWC